MSGIVLGDAIYPALILMDLHYVVALPDLTDGDLTAIPNSLRGKIKRK